MNTVNAANQKVEEVLDLPEKNAKSKLRDGHGEVYAATSSAGSIKKNLFISLTFTVVTTIVFGLLYPLAVTGLAQMLFPNKANGQLIERNGKLVGSRIIGQTFTSPAYFHGRPSSAGTGYDPLASGGSNLGPTNKTLIERVNTDVQKLQAENPAVPVPIDLVTSSASGLDPDISPASAEFQIARVGRARNTTPQDLLALIQKHTRARDWGFLGEPRVNVLELNLELDAFYPVAH
jgi:potassium-transporting ATPase KdpC subunit